MNLTIDLNNEEKMHENDKKKYKIYNLDCNYKGLLVTQKEIDDEKFYKYEKQSENGKSIRVLSMKNGIPIEEAKLKNIKWIYSSSNVNDILEELKHKKYYFERFNKLDELVKIFGDLDFPIEVNENETIEQFRTLIFQGIKLYTNIDLCASLEDFKYTKNEGKFNKDGGKCSSFHWVIPKYCMKIEDLKRLMSLIIERYFNLEPYNDKLNKVFDLSIYKGNGWFRCPNQLKPIKNLFNTEHNIIIGNIKDFLITYVEESTILNLDEYDKKQIIPKSLSLFTSEIVLPSTPLPNTTNEEAKNEVKNDNINQVKQLLERINPDLPYPEWIKIGYSCFNLIKNFDDSRNLFHEWSKKGSKYGKSHKDELAYINSVWNSMISNDKPLGYTKDVRKCGFSTLHKWANHFNPLPEEINGEQEFTKEELKIIMKIEDLKNHFNVAMEIKHLSKGKFIVCLNKNGVNIEKTLYCFNDFNFLYDESDKPLNRWYTDKSILKNWIATELYMNYKNEFNKIKHKIIDKKMKTKLQSNIDNLLNEKFREDVIKSCMDILWKEELNFDDSPELFCFTDCIYNLETEEFRDYTQNDYVTMNCGWAWNNGDSEEETNKKKDFVLNDLKTMFPDENDLKSYMYKFCMGVDGHAYQHFVFEKGLGANSKTLKNDTFRELLGDYGYKANTAILFEGANTAANPEIANMDKKRFIQFCEPQLKKKMENNIFKEICGGGEIKARRLYSNNCKVKLCGISVVELNDYLEFMNEIKEAEIRRIICILFKIRFTDDEKLIKEQPNIYKKKTKGIDSTKFKHEYRKAFLSVIFDYYKEFKEKREFYMSPSFKLETDDYVNSKSYLKKFILENYDILSDKFENKITEIETDEVNDKGEKIIIKKNKRVLVCEAVGTKNTDGIYKKFIESDIFNLLSPIDKAKFSNHIKFTEYLKNMSILRDLYVENKLVMIDGVRIKLTNVFLCLKEKKEEIIDLEKMDASLFEVL